MIIYKVRRNSTLISEDAQFSIGNDIAITVNDVKYIGRIVDILGVGEDSVDSILLKDVEIYTDGSRKPTYVATDVILCFPLCDIEKARHVYLD